MDMIHQLPRCSLSLSRSLKGVRYGAAITPRAGSSRISSSLDCDHRSSLVGLNRGENSGLGASSSKLSSGFRVYPGDQRNGSSLEFWKKILVCSGTPVGGFGPNKRSLAVIAAARRSDRGSKDALVKVESSDCKPKESNQSKKHSRRGALGKDFENVEEVGGMESGKKRRHRSTMKQVNGPDEGRVGSLLTSRSNNSESGQVVENPLADARAAQFKADLNTSGIDVNEVVSSKGRASLAVAVSSTKSLEYSVARGDVFASSREPEPSSRVMIAQQGADNGKHGKEEKKLKDNKVRKKAKYYTPDSMLRKELNEFSKDGDVLKAIELYDQSVADGVVKWNQYNFNVLLYLCSAAASGTLATRENGSYRSESNRERMRNGEEIEGEKTPHVDDDVASASNCIIFSPDVCEKIVRKGYQAYEHMKSMKILPNEATLTSVARLASSTGDGDLAFQMVKEMEALKLAPKLRSYSPALFTYCKQKEVDKAFEVDAHMLAAGLEPEELELGTLLQMCVEEGLADRVYNLLHRLRVTVRALNASTVSAVEQWFSQEAACVDGIDPDAQKLQQALVAGGGGWHGLGWIGRGKWEQKWTSINSEGLCLTCGEKLITIDLDPKETEKFARSLAELACSREAKPNSFQTFKEWVEREGPFDTIVDGANVGLYNQNFEDGGFNFHQLNAVVTALLDQGISRRSPLILLHHARARFGAALSPQAQSLLNKWRSTNSLYTTPNGSNDDWFWMYAAVQNKCLLVTNDEMRDHLFQLLGNDFFPKWKERHQVRFSCTPKGPQFHLPPPYSIVIQESETGSWHVPKVGGDDVDTPCEWLCVTRAETGRGSVNSDKQNNCSDLNTDGDGVKLKKARLNSSLSAFDLAKSEDKSENGTASVGL